MHDPRTPFHLSGPVLLLALIFVWPLGLVLLLARVHRDRGFSVVVGGLLRGGGIAFTLLIGLVMVATLQKGGNQRNVLIGLSIFLGGGLLATWLGTRLRDRGRVARRYSELVVNQDQTAIDDLAVLAGHGDSQRAILEVQSVIDQGFLRGYRLDLAARRVVRLGTAPAGMPGGSAAATATVAFRCRACGANNAVVPAPGQARRCEVLRHPGVT